MESRFIYPLIFGILIIAIVYILYNNMSTPIDYFVPENVNLEHDSDTSFGELNELGEFGEYVPKSKINTDNINTAYPPSREFVYKKKKYTLKSKEELDDQFDVSKMLPQDKVSGWFDDEPLIGSQVHGDDYINPLAYYGINTVSSGPKRNLSHDIRGDITNPKVNNIAPWGLSSLEPDPFTNSICGAN